MVESADMTEALKPASERENRSRSPQVSAIIPCYNRQQFIAETVESVLSQTYGNIELLVVDDGCTDRSREILQEFGDRLTILEHPGREKVGRIAVRRVRTVASPTLRSFQVKFEPHAAQ